MLNHYSCAKSAVSLQKITPELMNCSTIHLLSQKTISENVSQNFNIKKRKLFYCCLMDLLFCNTCDILRSTYTCILNKTTNNINHFLE